MKYKKDILSIPQAAEYCSVSRVTLWRWIKSDMLKSYQAPGGQYKIRKNDLLLFMKEKLKYLPLPIDKDRILIVDDDTQMQILLSKILASKKYKTEIASDGYEAGIKTMEFKPALIILDLLMPNMDGFETCKNIKSNPNTSHIKILAITAYDSEVKRKWILQDGADGYLPKPFSNKVLLEHVNKLLLDI